MKGIMDIGKALATINIDLIEEGRRLREISPAQVEAISQSIKLVGLLNPITVYARKVVTSGTSLDGYGLVAGAHRLAACKKLGLTEIDVVIVELSELERQIAECDENLCGSNLSKSERAKFTARRKEAYEALHPETRNGVIGALARHTPDKLAGASFTADTAAKTGQSERAIQRDAERGEKVIPEVLAMITGTKLDTGTYLDKIKNLSPNDQVAAAKRDLSISKQTAKHQSSDGTHAESKSLKQQVADATLEARGAKASADDFNRQLQELRKELAKLRDANDTLRHELAHARNGNAAKPDDISQEHFDSMVKAMLAYREAMRISSEKPSNLSPRSDEYRLSKNSVLQAQSELWNSFFPDDEEESA